MTKRAIVFAGQGSQFVGMGKDIADANPECAALFEKANEVLGYDLRKICFEGPEEELTKTSNCQPGIFVMSISCWTALRSRVPGLEFAAAGGLSLGEWSALHMAGAISFEDTVRVLEARGRFMQEACEEQDSGMVSIIGLPDEEISRIVDETGISVSNLNSPGQTVLSGEKGAVASAGEMAEAAGAKKVVPLKVAGAYHSPLMSRAAERLAEVLDAVDVTGTQIPVVSNATGGPHGDGADIRRDTVRQVTDTVRWCEDIEWLKAQGVTEYVECGPGRVLSGLIRRIDKEATVVNVQDLASLEKACGALGAPSA